MARPAHLPRLATLDPDELAFLIVESVLARLRQEATALEPVTVLADARVDPNETAVGQLVKRLLAYARGEGPLANPEHAIDAVARAAGVDPKAASVKTPIGLLLAAAEGRRALLAGEKMSIRDLATLGGVDQNALRKLAAQGKIVGLHGTEPPFVFAHDVARAWLAKQGVIALA